jgi:hypothetical protein
MQTGYLIGIRVDPDTEIAEWFTIWFEDEAGQNRVVAQDGRVRWARTAIQARNFAETVLEGRYRAGSEVESVCDVAGSLHAIASSESGSEGVVLVCLNFLDDLLKTIGHSSDLPDREILDRLVVLLTEGESLGTAVDLVGGRPVVIEPILASLGRLFTWSTFRC